MFRRVFGGLARKMGLRRRLNYSRRICINGVDISIPSILGIACGTSEPWMTDLLSMVLQQQRGAFLDVGVNVGQTLVKVKALDRDREYIGFEPNPVCVFYILELIKENRFENCTLLPVGLFTEDSVVPLDLFSDEVIDSSASLIKNFRPSQKTHSQLLVPVFRFDVMADLLGDTPVGIVKIDVEGAELEVVKSLLNVFRRDKPIVLIEILPIYSQENAFRKKRQDDLERIFFDLRYTILRVDKTSADIYSGVTRLEKIGIHSNLARCDYLVVPNEQLGKLTKVLDPSVQ